MGGAEYLCRNLGSRHSAPLRGWDTMKNILKSAVCAAAILVGTSGAFAQVDSDLMEGLKGRVVGPAAMS